MQFVLPALIVAVAVCVVGFMLWRALRGILSDRSGTDAMAMLQNQMSTNLQQTAGQVEALRKGLSESVQAMSGQVSRSLADTNRTVGDRLDNTTKVIGDVRQKLGALEQSSRRMVELGTDISRLQDILKPPKLRGALGELFLS